MLKYLIVMLDRASVPFCHHEPAEKNEGLISAADLKNAIRFGMKENLVIQFVYPDRAIPAELENIVETIDHVKIKPYPSGNDDVLVADISAVPQKAENETLVIRASIQELAEKVSEVENAIYRFKRVNIILKEPDSISEDDAGAYKLFLDRLTDYIAGQTASGKELPQFNLLTDRILLDKMNNCGAGDESITIAPDGKMYVCPAFYYDGDASVEWNKEDGLQLPNAQLYRLEHAPICRACDAFQCHRCVWLNRRRTLEVNTPGRTQCILSHHERNASRNLLGRLREAGIATTLKDIPELDYLDPFEIVK